MRTLARQIENELQHGVWPHCAIYEDELQLFWPLEAPYREVRIAAFAEKYGFRLRFYHKGMCAIFDRQPDNGDALGVERHQRSLYQEREKKANGTRLRGSVATSTQQSGRI